MNYSLSLLGTAVGVIWRLTYRMIGVAVIWHFFLEHTFGPLPTVAVAGLVGLVDLLFTKPAKVFTSVTAFCWFHAVEAVDIMVFVGLLLLFKQIL